MASTARAADLAWPRRLRSAIAGLAVIILILAGGLAARLYAKPLDMNNWPIPAWVRAVTDRDDIAFPAHVALGSGLNAVGAAPDAAALQWLKAASHARTDDDLARIAAGLMATMQRTADPAQFGAQLCQFVARGGNAPRSVVVLQEAGVRCNPDLSNYRHAAVGDPIHYSTQPPVAGMHYGAWIPTYGVLDQPVAPGYWVHNLEHGAIVLLYNCPLACPDLLAQITALFDALPANPNTPAGTPRLMALPSTDLDHQLAVITWGYAIQMDAFDADRIAQFYTANVDRGPECRNLKCPG